MLYIGSQLCLQELPLIFVLFMCLNLILYIVLMISYFKTYKIVTIKLSCFQVAETTSTATHKPSPLMQNVL